MPTIRIGNTQFCHQKYSSQDGAHVQRQLAVYGFNRQALRAAQSPSGWIQPLGPIGFQATPL